MFKSIHLNKYSSYILVFLFLAVFSNTYGQAPDCSINAGGNAIICGSSTTLTGSASGAVGLGDPTWTFVSGPVVPTIVSPTSMTTDVTGMTVDGDYVFKISHACVTGIAESEVIITAHPRPADFTAGADVTDVLATVGTVNLSDAVIPAGFTGTWSAYNIYSRNRFTTTVSTNSTFSDAAIANPDFSLIKKADHDIDPAYVLTLTITSLDGECTYEDTKVVRFIPNITIQPVLINGGCVSPPETAVSHFVPFQSAGPHFNTVIAETAANPAYGTTVTLNIVSQPPGGAIDLAGIQENSRAVLSGINVTGAYQFTLTVSNASGSYTTPTIQYTFNGFAPYHSLFNVTAHPEQLTLYTPANTGGEFHSSAKVGSTEPETFYFDINPSNPISVLTTVTQSGVLPPGDPVGTISVSGEGTANRTATVNAPAGGWQVGTYRFTISNRFTVDGCASIQQYYIHVSDSNRPDVAVDDFAICYPGTGAISATVQLPDVYKGVVNSSYFQDFSGVYNFTLLSSPPGAATPVYSTTNLRSLTSTSTIISNLDKAGDYTFRITAANLSGASTGPFLAAEYASSGTSMMGEFTIHVENRVNANAGSDQSILCLTTVSLIGNATGASSGQWLLIASPPGSDPVFASPTSPATSVTGLTEEGEYEFAWQITSPLGGCVSIDNVVVNKVCVPSIVIPAHIWVDANGDGITDVAEEGIANGLWANLLDPAGNVILSVAIQADGSYNLEVPKDLLTAAGDYSIVLTNSIQSVGTQVSEADTPLNDYRYTGTNRGDDTSADPANHTGALIIGDLSTMADGTTIDPVNFGIQRPPVADPKSYNVPNSAFNPTPPTGYPTESGYQAIPASSSSLTGVTGGSPSGSDPEDCATAGSCNTGTGTTFNIESINPNTKLYYDFGAGAVEIVVPTGSPVSIPDFDVTKLVIYGENGGGTGADLFGFTYSMTDKAGTTSPAVAYTIETEATLPVTLVNFTAAVIKGEVSAFARLKWQTSGETNSDRFEVQRSANGVQWKPVGVVAATGESSLLIAYDFDDRDNPSYERFYRLKSVDRDGTFALSLIQSVEFAEAVTGVVVYPNPSSGKVVLDGVNISTIKTIEILDQNGRNVFSKDSPTSNKLDVSTLPAGFYFVKIHFSDGRVDSKKISVSN